MDIASYLASLPQPRDIGSYTSGVGKIGANPIPLLWRQFAQQGESLINREYLSRLRAGAEGLSEGRRRYERDLMDAFSSGGLSPTLARAFTAETGNVLGEQVAGLQGGLEAERFSDLFGLSSGITNALAQAYGTERGAMLQLYGSAKAREAAREGAKSAQLSSLLGAGLTAAGFALGGPAGGLAAGTFAGSAANGLPSGSYQYAGGNPYAYGPYVPYGG
jgi:hypothetical protein